MALLDVVDLNRRHAGIIKFVYIENANVEGCSRNWKFLFPVRDDEIFFLFLFCSLADCHEFEAFWGFEFQIESRSFPVSVTGVPVLSRLDVEITENVAIKNITRIDEFDPCYFSLYRGLVQDHCHIVEVLFPYELKRITLFIQDRREFQLVRQIEIQDPEARF